MPRPAMPDPATSTTGPGRTAGGSAATVASASEVLDLAAWLLSPHRDRPAVVLTRGQPDRPLLDAHALARDYPDRVDVYLLDRSPDLTRELNAHLPESWQVFGDAARVYPSAGGPASSPVTAAVGDPAAAVRRIVDRALAAPAHRGAHATQRAVARPADRWPPQDEPHRIGSAADARLLAQYLCDAQRSVPVVVISIHPNAAEPYVDASGVADELRGLASVVVVDADATFGITEELRDPRLSVFYGAARVYPVGVAWLQNMYAAPLHLCTSAAQGRRVLDHVVADALSAAHAAGLLDRPAEHERLTRVVATVGGFSSDHHVVVRCDNRQQAILQVARLRLDIPPQRLLRRGQQLTGVLSGTGAFPEFIPDPVKIDAAQQVRSRLPDGTTVPAQVHTVTPDEAVVRLHPDYSVTLAREDTELTQLMSPGDVVAVEIAWVDGQCVAALGQESKAFEALPVLPGGPPWLLFDAAESAAALQPAPASAPLLEEAAPPAGRAGDQAADEAGLRRSLEDARLAADLYAEQVDALEQRERELLRETKSLKSQLRKDRAERLNRALPEVYADPEQQFRWEVGVTYPIRVAESDRAAYPLGGYVVGKAFLTRLDMLQGIPRHKVLDVVVDVLCDRAKDIPARELHPWLVKRSGTQEERHDGAKAWRVSLQVRSSSARRLKYWRLADGRIELDSVGVHDDGLK